MRNPLVGRVAAVLSGALFLTAAGVVEGISAPVATAAESAVALAAPYRHTLSITQDARESANPEPLTLPVSSQSVRLVLPDPTLQFAFARFRAFGANFESVGTVPLNRENHSVTISLPSDFFSISANHRPLDGLVATDPANYYGIELTGIGVPGTGPPPGVNVPTGPPLILLDAFLTFRSTAVSPVTAPSFDLRWDPERPWMLFDGRSSTHGEVTWIPSPQTVWAGDTVVVIASVGYFIRGLSERFLVEASITAPQAGGPPLALSIPFSVSADGSALTLTIPDAVRDFPLNEPVSRIDVSLTSGWETHERILVFLPLLLSPGLDATPPTVTHQAPTTDSRSVTAKTSVRATFSEPVTGVTPAAFTLRSPAGAVPARVDYAGATREATLTPLVPLSPDRRYTARLSGIRDQAGNLLATRSWSFVTGPAPIIRAVFPATGSTDVSRSRSLVATVNEQVLGVTSRTVKLVVAATGARVAATVTYDPAARTITLDPTADLATGTRYRATITGGTRAVRDLAGNPLGTQSMSFTTEAAP